MKPPPVSSYSDESDDDSTYLVMKKQKLSDAPETSEVSPTVKRLRVPEQEEYQLPIAMRISSEYCADVRAAAALPPPLRTSQIPELGWKGTNVGGAEYLAARGRKQPAEVAYHRTILDNDVDMDCLSGDLHHLSVRSLSGTEFDLELVPDSCGRSDALKKQVNYDSSLKGMFGGKLPHPDNRWCVNNPSNKPTARFRAGYLLINVAVKNDTEVLCSTESLELTFGGDALTLNGPAVRLGTRWAKHISKVTDDEVKAGAYLPLAITSDLDGERVYVSGVRTQTFLSELWFEPNFSNQTVSVSQVKESRTVGGKRLIYRQHKDALWEAIKLHTPIVLTDGCAFYLESTSVAAHTGHRTYPRRPEIFTFVCALVHPNTSGKVDQMDRLYRYRITRLDVVTPLIEEERSILLDVIRDWPTSEVKKAWGAGIINFNSYYRDFGKEYLGCKILPEYERILRYEAITVDMVRAPPQSQRSGSASIDTRTHDQKFFWAIFEYLYRRYPKKHWMILQVTGEGNCLFHCLAAWFAVMYPDRTDLHFYDWLRQQLCDILQQNIDVHGTPRNRCLSWLELFQLLTEQGGNPADKDLRGEDPPTQSLEERRLATKKQREAFQQKRAAYKERCKRNRAAIRRKYENAIVVGRQNCEFNTPMQLEVLPVLVEHVLSVGVFAAGKGYGEISPEINRLLPYNLGSHAGEENTIHVFLDPQTGAQHYVSAIEARFVAGFQVPEDKPKNTQTHDERGQPRAKVSANFKNYKR